MDTIVGAIVTLGVGVVVIAAIYQLGQSGNPIVPSATTAYNNTLSALFK
jgi:hypothetical protein